MVLSGSGILGYLDTNMVLSCSGILGYLDINMVLSWFWNTWIPRYKHGFIMVLEYLDT